MDAITAISIHLATLLCFSFQSFFPPFFFLNSPAATDFPLRKIIKDTLESVVKLHRLLKGDLPHSTEIAAGSEPPLQPALGRMLPLRPVGMDFQGFDGFEHLPHGLWCHSVGAGELKLLHFNSTKGAQHMDELSLFIIFFFPLCFSTSKSIEMRDLKVFERRYWKSTKANCFQHDYPAATGVNTAGQRMPGSTKSKDFSKTIFQGWAYSCMGRKGVGRGREKGRDYEILRRFREERSGRRMILCILFCINPWCWGCFM